MKAKEAIVVYGASSEHISPRYKEAAYRLGQLIAQSGRAVVCGGGRTGLMSAAINGAIDVNGEAIGVLPQFMVDRKWQHPQLTEMIACEDMHSRKRTMAQMSMAAIACPGGCGTLEEMLEIITWRQLNLFHGNVVILNIDGYYDPLIAMLQRTIEQGFMHADHSRLWQVATDADEAFAMATAPCDNKPFSQKIH